MEHPLSDCCAELIIVSYFGLECCACRGECKPLKKQPDIYNKTKIKNKYENIIRNGRTYYTQDFDGIWSETKREDIFSEFVDSGLLPNEVVAVMMNIKTGDIPMNASERQWSGEATELQWLMWFVQNSDCSIRTSMQEEFEAETGLTVPTEWRAK